MKDEEVKILIKYFPLEDEEKISKFDEFIGFFKEWNQKINLVSRKDIDNFVVHHLIHSLAVVKLSNFAPGQKIIDIGTGGGLPAIPLAIYYPETEFFLCDSILKKLKAVEAIAKELNLANINIIHSRAENLKNHYDIVTGRAVTRFPDFYLMFSHLLKKEGKMLYWTGNNTFDAYQPGLKIHYLSDYFEDDYFGEKIIIESVKGLKIK